MRQLYQPRAGRPALPQCIAEPAAADQCRPQPRSSREKLGVLVSPDHLKGIDVNHPAAPRADIPTGLPVCGRWFHLVSVLVTGIEAIARRFITAKANPRLIISSIVGNVFFQGHRLHCNTVIITVGPGSTNESHRTLPLQQRQLNRHHHKCCADSPHCVVNLMLLGGHPARPFRGGCRCGAQRLLYSPPNGWPPTQPRPAPPSRSALRSELRRRRPQRSSKHEAGPGPPPTPGSAPATQHTSDDVVDRLRPIGQRNVVDARAADAATAYPAGVEIPKLPTQSGRRWRVGPVVVLAGVTAVHADGHRAKY
jgi:hypothetical protein